MTMKCKPVSLVGMLMIISFTETSAFQPCRPSQLVFIGSGASHRRRKNSCAIISSSVPTTSALMSSRFDEFDDFDEFDSLDEWDDRDEQQQYDNSWDEPIDNRAAQFPPPPPYDRPPYSSNLRSYSSNLRNNIASSPSPYENSDWTKSSRYGNRNVNFNSRSNRNVNTFIRSANDPYKLNSGYGRETYRNSAPRPDYEVNYQSQYKGYPSRTTYSQDDNYAGRRRWEDSNSVRFKKKMYRDYDDVDNDPNSSRGRGGAERFNNSNNNNAMNGNNNGRNSYDFTSPRPPQYRDYDDPSDAPNRSYRQDSDGRNNGLPPPPQYRDYDDVNTEPNRSYRDDNVGSSSRFPPPPPQYRDYDDVNSAPSRSYRKEGPGNSSDSSWKTNSNNKNNNKFPPRRPPTKNNKFPPRRPPRPQSIPNNFASPQSNRSDSPTNNFPPGVGGMGYTPPSEYIPQNNREPRAKSTWSNSFREDPMSSSTKNPNYSQQYNTFNDRNPSNDRNNFRSPSTNNNPPPPPQSRYQYNDDMRYQYDVNRRETYSDGPQTQYSFPNGDVLRKERLNTLQPTGFNSIFSDMVRPFQQMFQSANQSLKSSDMLKEARLRIMDNEVVGAKLGRPLQVSTPFSQSSSMSSVNGKKASKVRARFQIGGPYGTGVATMDSVDGEIRSLVVDINGSTVRVGPRQRGKKKNVVEAEILEE